MTKLSLARLALACVAIAACPRVLAAETLVYGDSLAASHAFVQTADYFGKQVARDSGGQLTVSVRADGVLGNDNQMLDGVRDGQIAMVRVNVAQLAGAVRAAELASLPYLFRSEEHLRNVLQGPFGQRLDEELLAHGYVRLMYIYGGPRNLFCTRAIYGVSDFRKLRVRTLESPVFTAMFSDLGAEPVALPIGQTAAAFRNRQIDCAAGNVETYVSEELYRYASFLVQDEHARTPDVLLVSVRVWNRLAPAEQNILRAAASATMVQMLARWREVEGNALKASRRAGARVIPHEEIANNAIEEQAARFYSRIVKNDRDIDDVMKIVMTR